MYPTSLRELRDLPNEPGFKFWGVFADGTSVPCEVVREPVLVAPPWKLFGRLSYRCVINDGLYHYLSGWLPLDS